MYPHPTNQVTAENFMDDLATQINGYEILAEEDRRTRYLFFAGDTGGMPEPGGMRVQTRCVPKKTLYRCLMTPIYTVRQLELTNLIPAGAAIPGSADRVRPGCSEYWLYAGPEADVMMLQHGNPNEPTRNWGLVELAPHLLRGKDYERDIKPLGIQQLFFPEWPSMPATNVEVRAHLVAKIEEIKVSKDALIAANRDLYLTVGADMLRAVDAAQRHQEALCNKTNHGLGLQKGMGEYKIEFDGRDEISFIRSGLVKNTQALQRVAEEMKNGVNRNALDPATLERILASVVPAQQPAFTPEMLGAAIAAAMQMMQQQQPAQPAPVATGTEDKLTIPKPRNANTQRQPNGDSPAS